MTYLKHSNRPSNGRFGTVLAVIALVILFGINYIFPRVIPTIFLPITSLFWNVESGAINFLVTSAGTIQTKYNLIQENNRLTEQLATSNQALLALNDLQSENDKLKSDLGRLGKGSYVLGVILARPPVSLYDTLILDIGTNDGINVGDKVYAEGNILIGDISETYSSESKVNLFSMPGRVTSVLIGTTTIATDATGRGGGNFVAKLPAQTQIDQGAVIRIPQLKTHVFGVVDKILVDSTASVQTILFKLPVNINNISFVEVEKK